MKSNMQTTMNVNNNLVGVLYFEGIDYISLTDLARYKNPENPGDVIIKWMSNKSSFDFYSLWEELSNEDFKLAEFREFKIDSGTQSFTMSPSRWIKTTNAKGIISKSGKYGGGTFAHPDIALEFASWINPAYAWVYTIREAVVPGDVLLVRTSKGYAYMQVEKITNIARKKTIKRHKKVKRNITAENEKENGIGID